MSVAVAAIVVAGLCAVVLAAAVGGLDVTAAILLALIVVLGALAISVARKAGSGAVQPGTCSKCGGLVSPTAPYCKHCGEQLEA